MPGKVLVVEDSAANRIVLTARLRAASYETLAVGNGAGALAMAREARPDIVLLDLRLPDIDGIEVCRHLRADPATRSVAIVMVSAFAEPGMRLAALKAGADECLDKPLDNDLLLARLRSLMRGRAAEAELRAREATGRELGLAEAAERYDGRAMIGLVTRRPEQAARWRRSLGRHLSDEFRVMAPDSVLGDAATGTVPDLFILDADLGQWGSGLQLLSELRSRRSTRHSAVCILVPPAARQVAANALDLGASDVVFDTAEPEELAIRIRALLQRKRVTDRLRATVEDGLRLAVIDPLTGLYNRRYAMPHLARIAENAGAAGTSFAVMVLDIDRFKQVNDGWGHAAGDAVLAGIAERLRASLRASDLVARIGGEEFLVVLPECGIEEGYAMGERLRRAVQDEPFVLPGGGEDISVTLSVGLAVGTGTAAGDGPGASRIVLEAADDALRSAKSEGRNLVTFGRSAA